MGKRLLAIHAHPDDETITMGATLAVLADRGVETSLIICTDGKLATIVADDMPEDEYRHKLGAVRQDEMRAAGRLLGLSDIRFMEYGDSGMAGAETNSDPAAFWKADLDEVVGKLVAEIRRFRPHVVVTYDGFGGYGHPDHVQTHRAALLAVEASHTTLYPEAGAPWRVSKLYYTAFPVSVARHAVKMAAAAGKPSPFGDTSPEQLPFVVPDDWVTTKVPCREGVHRMRDALRAHHSQIEESFPLLQVPDGLAEQELGTEYFHLATTRVETTLPETDLFAGVVDAEEPAAVG